MKKNRLLSLLLCAAMCFSLFPAAVFAEEPEEAVPEQEYMAEETMTEEPDPAEPEEDPELAEEAPEEGSMEEPAEDTLEEAPVEEAPAEEPPAEEPPEEVPAEEPPGETPAEDPAEEPSEEDPAEEIFEEEKEDGEETEESDEENDEDEAPVAAASAYNDLLDAIDQGRDYELSEDLTVPAGQTVDARDITISIPAGITLTVAGRLIIGGLNIEQKPDWDESAHLTIPEGGNLHVTRWLDLGNMYWTEWRSAGSLSRLSFEDGNAGFTLKRGGIGTWDDLQIAFENAKTCIAEGAGHVRFDAIIPEMADINAENNAITISAGVTLSVQGRLWTNDIMLVEAGGMLLVSGDGNVHIEQAATVNGEVVLSDNANLPAAIFSGSGKIHLYDNSGACMHGGKWALENTAINSGIFEINDNTRVEAIVDADAGSFDGMLATFRGLPDHICGRLRIHYAMTVSSDLNLVSPKNVGLEVRGDRNSAGSLTVNTGATLSASFLDLHSSNMNVNGRLITTQEFVIQGEEQWPIGKATFAGDACLENQGGWISVRGVENQEDAEAAFVGLRMERFNVTPRRDGFKFVDTGATDFASSAELKAAAEKGEDFTVTKNILIAADETIDASGIRISIDKDTTLMVKGKLILGDFYSEFYGPSPADWVRSGRLVVSGGGEVHVTKRLEIQNATWTVWEQDGSVNGFTYEDDAGFILHHGVTEETGFQRALGDAEKHVFGNEHLFFVVHVPEGVSIELTEGSPAVQRGITVMVEGTLTVGRNANLVVEDGAYLTAAKGGTVVVKGNVWSNGVTTVAEGGTFSMVDSLVNDRWVAGMGVGRTGCFVVNGTLNYTEYSMVSVERPDSIAQALAMTPGVPQGLLDIDAGSNTASGYNALWDEGVMYPEIGTINLSMDNLSMQLTRNVPVNFCLIINAGSSLTVAEGTTADVEGVLVMEGNGTEGGIFTNNGTLNILSNGGVNFQRSAAVFVNSGTLNLYGGIGVHSFHGDTTATLTNNGTLYILDQGYIEDSVTVTGNAPKSGSVHVHSFTLSGWTWTKTDGGYRAEATFTCLNCTDPDNTENPPVRTVEAKVESRTDADTGMVTYTATLTGPDGETYTDEKVVGFVISGVEDVDYTGAAITFDALRVTYDDVILVSGTDYTVKYANNKTVGTATVTVTGKGNYAGSAAASFAIRPISLAGEDVTADDLYSVYTGKAQAVKPVVKWGKTLLKVGTDYTVSPANCKEEGDHVITLTGKGNFRDTRTITFSIRQAQAMSKATVALAKADTSKAWTGMPITPEPVVSAKVGKETVVLVKDTDYTVSYRNNVAVGTATVTVTALPPSGYIGTKSVTFKITGTPFTKATVGGISKAYDFVNGSVTPEPTVTLNGKVLTRDTDYRVEYQKNNAPGTATVLITGIGAYDSGSKKVTFKINKYDLSKNLIRVEVPDSASFLKGGAKPVPTVIFGNDETGYTVLREGADFTCAYKNNKAVGSGATVTVTGKGNYSGSRTVSFRISPKALNSGEVVLSATDLAVAPTNVKMSAAMKAPALTDADGARLAAGKDYEKTAVFTYGEAVTLIDPKTKAETPKAAGTEVTKNDVLKSVPDGGLKIIVTVKAVGADYTGELSGSFRLIPKAKVQSIAKATVKIANQPYTGNPVTLSAKDFNVTLNGKALTLGTDFVIVSYSSNVKPGTAKVTLRGIGNCSMSKMATFRIDKKALA
ncbi:MAG: hypothetical protein K6C12_09590 [Oscillospiraceae bacterium]|nr:hypothetical protein [Oscillospiraceae bacterium]